MDTILTKEKQRGSIFVCRQSVRQNCGIWYSGIFLCVMTLVKTSGGLAFSSITADSLHPPQGCCCTVASQQGAQNSILQLGKPPSKGGKWFLKINQPHWGMMMRDRVLSTWTGWLHDESQWLCFYNSIVEGEKQNKSWWRIDITHRSFQWPQAHGIEFMRTHTHTHIHTCTHTHTCLFRLQGELDSDEFWTAASLSPTSPITFDMSVKTSITYTLAQILIHTWGVALSVAPRWIPTTQSLDIRPSKQLEGPISRIQKSEPRQDEERLWQPWLGISYHQAKGHAWYAPHAMPPSAQAIDTPLIFLSVSIFYDRMPQFPPHPHEWEGRHRRVRAMFSQTPPLSSSDITVSDASLICKSVNAMQKVIDVVSMATM